MLIGAYNDQVYLVTNLSCSTRGVFRGEKSCTLHFAFTFFTFGISFPIIPLFVQILEQNAVVVVLYRWILREETHSAITFFQYIGT